MKGTRYLLIGLVFGMMMGWALGFLRLPYIEKNWSFLLGFVAALVVVSLLFLLLAAWNPPGWTGKKGVVAGSNNTGRQTFLRRTLVSVFVLGAIASGFAAYRRYEGLQRQIHHQHRKMQDMAALIESMQKNDVEPLIHSVLDEVSEELKRSPGRTLSDTLITRIAALSLFFKPYPSIESDSVSKKLHSPERGQLLQALILMNLDSSAFRRIKQKTVFAGADLRDAHLKGLDLSGIQLQGAHLQGADLSGANLTNADLEEANLWGAHLNQANLSHADLKEADLSWAQLNETILTLADLTGATLFNTQMRKAVLNETMFRWAQVEGVLFNEANLTNTDFMGTAFRQVNFSQADMRGIDLRKINLNKADLVGVQLDKASIDKNWLDQLNSWQPAGMKEIQDGYTVVSDTVDKFKTPLYRLKKN